MKFRERHVMVRHFHLPSKVHRCQPLVEAVVAVLVPEGRQQELRRRLERLALAARLRVVAAARVVLPADVVAVVAATAKVVPQSVARARILRNLPASRKST